MDHNDKEIKVQRDLYSAFLIKNVNSDLKTINNKRCIDSFNECVIII